MPASKETVAAIAKILRKRLDKKTRKKLVADLLEVEGSASFKETMGLLSTELATK